MHLGCQISFALDYEYIYTKCMKGVRSWNITRAATHTHTSVNFSETIWIIDECIILLLFSTFIDTRIFVNSTLCSSFSSLFFILLPFSLSLSLCFVNCESFHILYHVTFIWNENKKNKSDIHTLQIGNSPFFRFIYICVFLLACFYSYEICKNWIILP